MGSVLDSQEQQQAGRRIAPAQPPPEPLFPSISDTAARELLEEILRLRREGAAQSSDGKWATAAADAVSKLAAGVGGWAIARIAGTVPREHFNQLSKEWRRSVIRKHLGSPCMQPGASRELAEALVALNAGQVNSLVEPTITGRRRMPYETARLELAMLSWIRWRKGRGGTVAQAKQEMAAAVGRSVEAFPKWRHALVKLMGADHVRCVLDDAEAAGRLSRVPPVPPLKAPIDAHAAVAALPPELLAKPYLVRVNLRMATLSLEGIGRRYNAAAGAGGN